MTRRCGVQRAAARRLRPGTTAIGCATISFFPFAERPIDVALRRDRQITTFGMEFVPRISRAQSMDALSSQALVAGYRGAIVAAGLLAPVLPAEHDRGRHRPAGPGGRARRRRRRAPGDRDLPSGSARWSRATTCARPPRRRSGRWALRRSTSTLPTLEGAGGYAREMTEDRAARQRELLRLHRRRRRADHDRRGARPAGADAGDTEMVEQMKPGSVVVDLAAESGGNVEGSVAGEVVRMGNAQVWGGRTCRARCRPGQSALRPERR